MERWKGGDKINYYRYADKKPFPQSSNYRKTYFLFTPYAIAKIGPVALQAEFNYATGESKEYDKPDPHTDVKMDNISGWIDATATFTPATPTSIYVGGTIAYVSGDDPGTSDREEGGTLTGGVDWNPCLILFNNDVITYWEGGISGYNATAVGGTMKNAWFGQGRVGVKPVSNLDIMASVSYAQADKKPTGFIGGTYGTEIDLTGTYKITSNLSYMLGFGYLFTGDYFKGTNGDNKVVDDYTFINKLTLTF